MDPLKTPTSWEHLITPDLVAYEGLGYVADAIKDNPSLRSALLLRATTTLREQIMALPFEASSETPVTIEAQDALVLLDLMLRRLG